MTTTSARTGHEVRSHLDHPVIDVDGHVLEVLPVYLDYLKDVGGSTMAKRLLSAPRIERRNPSWWIRPTDALDRVSASVPRLLHQRLDDMGIDYCVLYPTEGNQFYGLADQELRHAACRAYNNYQADMFREYSDRLSPAAIIPMNSPQEAIDELEHVAKLELKVGAFSLVWRSEARPHREDPTRTLPAGRVDTFGIDSDYDYDPVWAKFLELRIAPTSHSISSGWGSRKSPSSFMYNHIGHFAAASEALCKSLLMGGVTRRFPTIKIAFMEGGAAWACSLFADLIDVWRKRNPESLRANLDPALLDRQRVMRLFAEYGNDKVRSHLEGIREFFSQKQPEHWWGSVAPRPDLDEWGPAHIRRAEDFLDLFVPHFYFGCEADARTTAWAFNTRLNPFGARLRAIFGSDLGHWDVAQMDEVVAEAYEAVEDGLFSEEDFREFVFLNPVRLYTGLDPEFFKGTRIEGEVDRVLRQGV